LAHRLKGADVNLDHKGNVVSCIRGGGLPRDPSVAAVAVFWTLVENITQQLYTRTIPT